MLFSALLLNGKDTCNRQDSKEIQSFITKKAQLTKLLYLESSVYTVDSVKPDKILNKK